MRLEVQFLSGAHFFMFLEFFSAGPFETNGYIFGDKEVFLVDAPLGSFAEYNRIIEKNDLIPKGLLLTHSHLDHTADCQVIAENFSIPVYVHPLDDPNVRRPGSDRLPVFLPTPPYQGALLLKDGEKLWLGSIEIDVIHTPGHTPGGVCFYLPQQGILFSGDTLFKGTIGNLSFPTAEPEKMWQSLKKLALLPTEVVVYPGHGPKTTIGRETFLSSPETYFS